MQNEATQASLRISLRQMKKETVHCIDEKAPRFYSIQHSAPRKRTCMWWLCATRDISRVHLIGFPARQPQQMLPRNPLLMILAAKRSCTEAEMRRFEWVQRMLIMQPVQNYTELTTGKRPATWWLDIRFKRGKLSA
jgi:hypothetical protein